MIVKIDLNVDIAKKHRLPVPGFEPVTFPTCAFFLPFTIYVSPPDHFDLNGTQRDLAEVYGNLYITQTEPVRPIALSY